MNNTKKQWDMPQLMVYGDVEQLTQQDTVTVKCPGSGDSAFGGVASNTTREVNLPVGASCTS